MEIYNYIEQNKYLLTKLLTPKILECIPTTSIFNNLKFAITHPQNNNIIIALQKLDLDAIKQFCTNLSSKGHNVLLSCFYKKVTNIDIHKIDNTPVDCVEQAPVNDNFKTNYINIIYYMNIDELAYPLYSKRVISYIDFSNILSMVQSNDRVRAMDYLINVITTGNKEQYDRFIAIISQYQPMLLEYLL